MNLTSTERLWARDIWDTIFPAGGPRLGLGMSDLDADGFLVDFARSMPRMAVLGFRVAVLAIALAPLFMLRKLRTFHGLSRPERLALLEKLYASNVYFLRSFVTLVKAAGALLYVGTTGVRKAIIRGRASSPNVALSQLRRRRGGAT